MKLHIILLIIFVVLMPVSSIADKASKLNKEGIESYNEQKLEESVNLFTEALVERPDSPELRFNRGTALSAVGKKDEAISELEKSSNTFKKSELSAASHFNAGNTYFTSGDLNGAIEEYKKAVKLDQSSKDIRHNLELALRMLRDQQQQQKNKDNEEDKENGDEEKQTKQDQDENKEQKENENEEKQNEQDQQPQQQENEQQPMTPEEAQRILDALNDEEKKAFELRKMKMLSEMRQGDDW